MIRPVTLITFAAFIGSGIYLYQVKHQAQLVDRQIRKVQETTGAARERAGVLRAEYALLNDPDRLAGLAAAYVTDLKPTLPGQWSSMAEIDRRLPSVGGPTAEPAPLEPDARAGPTPLARAEPARAEPARPAPHPAPVAVASLPEPAAPSRAAPAPAGSLVGAAKPAPRPTVAARAQPAAPQMAQAARSPAPQNQARAGQAAMPAQVAPPVQVAPPIQVASAPLPWLRSTGAPGPSLLPRVSPPKLAPAGASVLAVANRPGQQQDFYAAPPATTGEAVARAARGGQVDPSVPVVASALGMARTMMAVTPVSPANAGSLYPQATVTR